MQISVIEYARNVLGFADAHSREFDENSTHRVIDFMSGQNDEIAKGGTLRLGSYPCSILTGSRMEQYYKSNMINERHRHRYEFNNDFREELTDAGLLISGTSPDRRLVEAVEIPINKFHLGVQFHPEFKSRPNKAHPLFLGLIENSLKS
jgi:CTP synthase